MYHSGGDGDNGHAVPSEDRGTEELSGASAQFCYEPKTTLKKIKSIKNLHIKK